LASLNYHRPCGFATVEITARGQRKRRYRPDDYRTPYEKLLSLPRWEQFLKPGVTAALLAAQRHPAQRYRGRPADAVGQSHTADPLPEAAPPENSLAAGGTRPISGELKQGKRAAAPLPRTPIPRYTQRQKKGASQQE